MPFRITGLIIALLAVVSIACTGARPPSGKTDREGKQAPIKVVKKTFEEIYGPYSARTTG